MKRTALLLLVLTAATGATAQRATVDEWLTEVTCDQATHATTRHVERTTLHNEQAAGLAGFSVSCSKRERLTAFRGQVTDAAGRVIRKFKESELQRTEYSQYLAVDDYRLYLEYTPPSYPVTITYEWTTDSRDNLVEFPWFVPQGEYDVDVRQATYRLTAPKDMTVRYSLQNIDATVATADGPKDTQVLTLSLSNLPAIRQEHRSRPLRERMPLAYFAPEQFVYYGTKGSLASWNDYGLWENSLLEGRDELPADIKAEVHRLTDALPTPRQKAERLYKLLEQQTRYVAVLLGIGGQQPAPAAQVAKSGFGDCKGLSNYLRALLKEIGIDARYTAISTRNRRLLADFPSVGQMNHVILQVPLAGDTLWLECTNPELPFGYIHEDIAGHDAITIGSEGGRLVTLPAPPDTANTLHTVLQTTLDATGKAAFALRQTARNRQYEHHIPLLKADHRKQQEFVQRLLSTEQTTVSRMDVKSQGAAITLDAELQSPAAARNVGPRLMVALNPVRHGQSVPPTTHERTEPLYIGFGYLDEDEVTLTLPEGYTIENLPKDVTLDEPFGHFEMHLHADGLQLRATYSMLMRAGTYPKEQYAGYVAFLRAVVKAYGQKVVLKRAD